MASLPRDFWLKKIFASVACASQGGLGIKSVPFSTKLSTVVFTQKTVFHVEQILVPCVSRGTYSAGNRIIDFYFLAVLT